MRERYFENNFVEIWFENGIIYQTFKLNTNLTLESAKKVVKDRIQVSNNTTTPICIDIRNLVSADLKAHKFMASKEAVQFISAGAFIVNNVINRMLMNLFSKVFKPVVPAASFTNVDEAIQWLEKYKYLN